MPLGVDSRKMRNKINWEGLCILITVLESSGGNSFLVTHNLTQNRTCTLLVAVGQYTWGIKVLQPWPFLLFSLGMSAVLGSFCPSLLLCPSPSKFQIPRRTDVPLQLTAAPLCSCLPSVSFIISGSSDDKLASASRRSWSIAQRICGSAGKDVGWWHNTCSYQSHQLSQSLRRQSPCQAALFATTF